MHHLRLNNFNVTLLTRDAKKTSHTFPGLRVVHADYDSVDALTKVFREKVGPQDAVVVLINRNKVRAQINVMEASVSAGITHIIPSCFGIGTRNPLICSTPIWETKKKMEDWVIENAEKGRFTFTGVQNGVFFDWALEHGVFLNTKGDKPFPVFDGGDVPFSVTTVDDIGKATAAALTHADQLRNKFVFLHNAAVTQNQLLAYAKEAAPEKQFKVLTIDTEQLEKESWEKWNAGDHSPEVMRGFMPRVTFGHRMGVFDQTDNELLGIEQWSNDRLKKFVASYVR